MTTRRTWGAAALAAAALGGLAAFASSPGGPTPPALAFAGTLKKDGAPYTGRLQFAFFRDGALACSEGVDVFPDADGAFEAPLLMSACPDDLWDGRDVTYDVDVVDPAGNVKVVARHPVRPVPLAKFADAAGAAVRTSAAPPCDARHAGAIHFDPTLRQFLGCDGNAYLPLSANGPQDTAPPGTVIFYDGSTCPTGWTELQEARGRYLVGLQPAQPARQQIGTALSAGENRPAGQHIHPASTDVQGYHAHGWSPAVGAVFVTGGTNNLAWGISTPSPGYGLANMLGDGNHGHNLTVGVPAGSAAGTPAPYLSLLVCRKD